MMRTPFRSDVVHNRELESDASYRVLRRAGRLVQVEVVHAPGLGAGTRVYMTRAAVGHMEHERRVAEPRRAAAGGRHHASPFKASPA